MAVGFVVGMLAVVFVGCVQSLVGWVCRLACQLADMYRMYLVRRIGLVFGYARSPDVGHAACAVVGRMVDLAEPAVGCVVLCLVFGCV